MIAHKPHPNLCVPILIPVLAMLLIMGPVLYGGTEETQLPITNPIFVAEEDRENRIIDWTFESIKLIHEKGNASVKQVIKPEGDAMLRVPKDGNGVLLKSTLETARGDLISAPFRIEPYTWIEVTLQYRIESGEPLPFVCLRPTKKRAHVDLAFLPRTPAGKMISATVRLHSGGSKKKYSLSVSIIGKGVYRACSIKAVKAGDYPRPDKPLFVLDTLHIQPPKDGKLDWSDAERLRDVFGFPSLEFLHYSEVTEEKLKALDPGMILISPKSEELPRSDYQVVMNAAQTVMEHGAPVVGICQGHQIVPMLDGAFPARKVMINDDGSREVLCEWGELMIDINKEDPIFEGLPRYPRFCASLTHFAMVPAEFEGAEILASTELCETQVLKYPHKPCYTFQAHIERGWEYACPESCLIWKNLLRHFFLAP